MFSLNMQDTPIAYLSLLIVHIYCPLADVYEQCSLCDKHKRLSQLTTITTLEFRGTRK